MMRTDARSLLINAAAVIEPRKDKAGYSFMLLEFAEHIQQVRDGQATLSELAKYYMLTSEGDGE